MALWQHMLAVVRAGSVVALLVAAMCCGSAYAGEPKWSPTVVTTVATSPIAQGAPVRAPLPQWADPRFTPKQMYTRQSGSLPDGAWSSIVTGTVPEEGGTGGGEQPHGQAGGTAAAPAQPHAQPAQGGEHGGAAQAQPSQSKPEPSEAAGDSRPPREKPLQGLPPDATPAQQYCFNTADSAADARFAWQQKKIKDMEAELDKRAQALQERTEEYKTWLARRDEFSRKAQEKLVAFYAKMKPDAAALQLGAMDEDLAAALLMKLEPKAATLFMAEMDPAKAAKLASLISGLSKVAAAKKQKAANAASPPGAPGVGAGAVRPQAQPGQSAPQPGAPRS